MKKMQGGKIDPMSIVENQAPCSTPVRSRSGLFPRIYRSIFLILPLFSLSSAILLCFTGLTKLQAQSGQPASAQKKPDAGRPVARLTLRYPLNTTVLDSSKRKRLREFAKKHYKEGYYLLLQGYACDQGGYKLASRTAGDRARNLINYLSPSLIPAGRYRVATDIVVYDEPRSPFRKIDIGVFEGLRNLEVALTRSNRLAQAVNNPDNRARQREILQQAEAGEWPRIGPSIPDETEGRPGPNKTGPTRQAPGWPGWLWLVLIVTAVFLILILVAFIVKQFEKRRMSKHYLSDEENEALQILTGESGLPSPAFDPHFEPEEDEIIHENEGEITPVAVPKSKTSSKPETPVTVKSIAPGTIIQRSKPVMAKKKKTTKATKTTRKITPRSINGALSKSYEDKSMKELARSPIDALEGLTPRHAILLEEAFGVKTVEDLSRLKYFEIARAIVVLSKYEG